MIKYPEKIKKLKLGFLSISDGASQKLNMVTNYLKKNNAFFECSPFAFESINQVSSDAKTRASEFLRMWNSNEINYIISSFGGEFCMEILPYILEYKEVFLNNKKWIQGFSDTNFLSYFLTTNYNLATINYYNAEDYGSIRNLNKLKLTIDILSKLEQDYCFIQTNSENHIDDYSRSVDDSNLKDVKTLVKSSKKEISFSGRVIGGWIETLSTICGTKYDKTQEFCEQFSEGTIWYIDNCELSSPMLRRKLWQISQAGYFNNCNGILLGREPIDEFDGNYSYSKAITDTFEPLGIPVIEDVDIGHFFPQWLMINGSYAEVNYIDGKVKILQRLK